MAIEITDLPERYQRQAMKKIKRQEIGKVERKNKNKYNAKRVEFSGIKFDSKKEQRRFVELIGLQHAGRITDLKLQHNFTLREGYTTTDGERVQGTIYKADFTYYDEAGNFIIEDVKGRKTDVYQLKKKMMRDKGFKVKEV